MHSSLITLVFLALIGWFAFGPSEVDVPRAERIVVPAAELLPTTLRQPLGDDPTIEVVPGMQKNCQTCHSIFESPPVQRPGRIQHLALWLDHGENDNCLNCHDRDNRDVLALRNGKTVGFSRSPELCAQCHGTTWRDWQAGSHGRTDGYWDKSKGGQTRQVCVACHDPHHPAFPVLEPYPAPNTLRMSTPLPVHDSDSPLARFGLNAPQEEQH